MKKSWKAIVSLLSKQEDEPLNGLINLCSETSRGIIGPSQRPEKNDIADRSGC